MSPLRVLGGWVAPLVAVALLGCRSSDDPVVPEVQADPEVSTVEVTPKTVSFSALQETGQLTATARDASGAPIADKSITWKSSAPDVASVNSDGKVTATGNGEASITATVDGVSGTAGVAVSQEAALVTVTPSTDTLFAFGDTLRLSVEAEDANAHSIADPVPGWKSSDESVATVDGGGLVTAVDLGTALITASMDGEKAESEITVDDGEFNYDIGPNVSDSIITFFKYGLLDSQAFLNDHLGGDIPPETRTNITLKIIATGEGNQEEGGFGGCCSAFSINDDRESIIRFFFDVQHEDWLNRPSFVSWSMHEDREVTVLHEYVHGWQHSIGCITMFWQPLGNWINEGMANWLGFREAIQRGVMPEQDVYDFMVHSARATGQLDAPLEDLRPPPDGPMPTHAGYVAIDMLMKREGNDMLSFKTICEKVADGHSVDEAFEIAFGISRADFYVEFEEWRLENK